MGKVRRHLYWFPEGDPGCEQLDFSFGTDGLRAVGLVLRGQGNSHFRCRYELEADGSWQFQRLVISTAGDSDQPCRREIIRDAQGDWLIDGEAASQLAGCSEVDIQVTPFTNTLPIRRLQMARGERQDLRVAYVPLPSLDVEPVDQRYTCLVPLGTSGGLYRYEGLFRNFSADLQVDSDGLVLDYPETFRRQWPR